MNSSSFFDAQIHDVVLFSMGLQCYCILLLLYSRQKDPIKNWKFITESENMMFFIRKCLLFKGENNQLIYINRLTQHISFHSSLMTLIDPIDGASVTTLDEFHTQTKNTFFMCLTLVLKDM